MNDWSRRVKDPRPESFEMGNLWSEGDTLSLITDDFADLVQTVPFDSVACIEAKGFILGSALAQALGLPLLAFRRAGKIRNAEPTLKASFTNWRGEPDGLEIESDELERPRRLLVVDDLAYKLSTFKAVAELVGRTESRILAFLCFANLSGEESLAGARIYSLMGGGAGEDGA
jgi:adenine phosphoribosyltransferase